jgi:hypothetical protein
MWQLADFGLIGVTIWLAVFASMFKRMREMG